MMKSETRCAWCEVRDRSRIVERFVWVVFVVAVGWVALSISPADKQDVTRKKVANVAKIQSTSAENRSDAIAAAIEGLSLSRDKIEKISFYTAGAPQSDPLSAYISAPDAAPATLHIRASYRGEKPLFFQKIKILADDVLVYERDFGPFDVDYNVAPGSSYETLDYTANDEAAAALRAIAKSSSVIVRFSSNKRHKDFELSKNEIKNLGAIVQAHDALSKL